MGLYAIGDLHLSLDCDKPMDIFSGWDNYVEKLKENWNNVVTDEDTVVVAGDISWAMSLGRTYKDFAFINSELSGRKILMKGNHDYWWTTLSKMNTFLEENGFGRLKILHNNAYEAEGFTVCGTRGWINDTGEPLDQKVLAREAGRLEASIKAGLSAGGEALRVFLHYPPIYGGEENVCILEVLQKYGIKHCYYGHIHGAGVRRAFQGERYGIKFHLISADLVGFTPQKVE